MPRSAAEEAALLEGVEMKMAMADTSAKLAGVLKVYLAPVISSLASEHEATRNKIVGMCSHVTQRVRAASGTPDRVALPLRALAGVLQDPASGSLARNFAHVFLQLGIPDATSDEAREVLPAFLTGIAGIPAVSQPALLQATIQLLGVMWREAPEGNVTGLDVSQQSQAEDGAVILRHVVDLLLLTLPSSASAAVDRRVTNDGKAAWATSATALTAAKTSAMRLAALDGVWTADELPVLQFAAALAAAGDTSAAVQELGQEALRRVVHVDRLPDAAVARVLYELFHRSRSVELQVRVIGYLCRSSAAASMVPEATRVITESVLRAGNGAPRRVARAGLGLVQWVARTASVEALTSDAGRLLASGLWDLASMGAEDEMRAAALEAMAQLIRRVPRAVVGNEGVAHGAVAYAEQLFGMLARETSNVRGAVLDALAAVLRAAAEARDPPLSAAEVTQLHNLAVKNEGAELALLRLAAVRCTVEVLLSVEVLQVPAALRCAVASRDADPSVREMAMRGLAESLTRGIPLDELAKAAKMVQPGQLHGGVYEFLWRTLLATALSLGDAGSISDSLVLAETPVVADVAVRDALRTTLLDPRHQTTVAALLELIQQTLTDGKLERGVGEAEVCAARLLYHLVAMSPATLVMPDRLADASSLLSLLAVKNDAVRAAAARVVAIVAVRNSHDALYSLVAKLASMADSTTDPTRRDEQHGALCALGLVLGHAAYANVTLAQDASKPAKVIMGYLEKSATTPTLLLAAAAAAVGNAACFGGFPAEHATAAVESLQNLVRSSAVDSKVRHAALEAVARLAVGDRTLAGRTTEFVLGLDAVFEKDVERLLAVGEALSVVGGGWASTSLARELDCSELPAPSTNDEAPMVAVVDALVDAAAPQNSPSRVRAAALWLLAVLQLSGNHVAVQSALPRIHGCLARLLGARDAVTQEAAALGLGRVAEVGGQALGDELSAALPLGALAVSGTFAASGAARGHALDSDAAKAIAADGGGPFELLLAVARDLNLPGIAYQLMCVASQSASWITAATKQNMGALGIAATARRAREALAPHLGQLLPLLYVLRFDPSPAASAVVRTVWESLSPSRQDTTVAATEQAAVAALDTCLEMLSSPLWRRREAACGALGNALLSAAPNDAVASRLDVLWARALRTLDDVKETVRVAALGACKALAGATFKSASSSASPALDRVVPFLVSTGLQSASADVRTFALDTILQLCGRQDVPALQAHTPALVTALLEGLTAFEPQVLNYLTFHIKSAATSAALENARAQSAQSSRTMDAVQQLVMRARLETAVAIVDAVLPLLRGGLGVPTRAGCARTVVLLAIYQPDAIRAREAPLLKGLGSAIQADRAGGAVRGLYASALGHVARFAGGEAVAAVVDQVLQPLYVRALEETDDAAAEAAATAPATVLRELSRLAPDRVADCASVVLPLAFVAMHDRLDPVASAWREVWEAHTGGSARALALHLESLCALCDSLVSGTQSWAVKRQVGASLRDLVEQLGASVAPVAPVLVGVIMPCLAGRTWDGKERFLDALVTLCIALKDSNVAIDGVPLVSVTGAVVLREGRKQNKKYRPSAFEALGRFAAAFGIPEPAQELPSLVEMLGAAAESATSPKDEDESMSDSDTAAGSRDRTAGTSRRERLARSAIVALGQLFPARGVYPEFVEKLQPACAFEILGVFERVSSAAPAYAVQMALADALGGSAEALLGAASDSAVDAPGAATKLLGALEILASPHNAYTGVREKAAGVLSAHLVELVSFSGGVVGDSARAWLQAAIEAERLSSIRERHEQLLSRVSSGHRG